MGNNNNRINNNKVIIIKLSIDLQEEICNFIKNMKNLKGNQKIVLKTNKILLLFKHNQFQFIKLLKEESPNRMIL